MSDDINETPTTGLDRMVNETLKAFSDRDDALDQIVFLREVKDDYDEPDAICRWDEILNTMDALSKSKALNENEWYKVASAAIIGVAGFLHSHMPPDPSRYQRMDKIAKFVARRKARWELELELKRPNNI